jgi:GH24 family phage-related lysozyme (muramidase)
MPTQMKLTFSQNTIQQINVYHQAPVSESATDGAQVKLTPTQKEALRSICAEHNIGMSTFLRDALDAYIELFPFRDKIAKNKQLLRALLNSLS